MSLSVFIWFLFCFVFLIYLVPGGNNFVFSLMAWEA